MELSQNASRSTTPPHVPTYGIHVSDDDIRKIVKRSLPSAEFVSKTALPQGSSYNNRLYFVSVRIPNNDESPAYSTTTFVLKVCGRFWERHKTLNEVMCLKLIRIHCPDLPVPEVIAWSDDRGADESIGNELRSRIPSSNMMGNVFDVSADGSVSLGRSVDTPSALGWPWRSYLHYNQALLENCLVTLESKAVYKQNRYLPPIVRDFIAKFLPGLRIFNDPAVSASVLTHGDLSDRNILVARTLSGDPRPEDSSLHIVGLVDWEFSGFFSPADEFLTASDEMLGDIVQQQHDRGSDPADRPFAKWLWTYLEEKGVSTPRRGFISEHWVTAQALYQLRDSIAPWWVHEEMDECELTEELDAAAIQVKSAIRTLTDLC